MLVPSQQVRCRGDVARRCKHSLRLEIRRHDKQSALPRDGRLHYPQRRWAHLIDELCNALQHGGMLIQQLGQTGDELVREHGAAQRNQLAALAHKRLPLGPRLISQR